MKNYYIYDIETYPNCFLMCGKFLDSQEHQIFEISDRINEKEKLFNFLAYLRNIQVEMVGYNNIGFDYPIIHEFIVNPYTFTFEKASQIANTIISSQNNNGRGFNSIKYSDRLIPQIDLFKLCHFDNDAKRTSLKALQFAMRSHSVEDTPFKIQALNDQEKDILRSYNLHDVLETEKFLKLNEHHIEMRREYLSLGTLFGDVLNFSDVKIGTEYLISRIGRNKCFVGGKPRQTMRESITFSNIILSKIYYRTEPFQNVLDWFKQQKIYITHSERPSLKTTLCNLDFHFGVGGVHASAENKIFETDENYQIIDIDVAGMYVAVGIANKFAPEHLGESFILAYSQIKDDRAKYTKGSSHNAALKLAGNGAYGNSNNPFSPLYDPKYTFSVTTNGQLQILQLVEMISLLPDCELIQANTDGITIRINKNYINFFNFWCREWEKMTGLQLEEVLYKKMWIRDVNNYIAEKMNGSLKTKGAYAYPSNIKDYDGWWNKDYSNLASIKAAVKSMTSNLPLEIIMKMITDPFDFMLRYKTPSNSKLFIGDTEQLRTVRYYVSLSGQQMRKVSPPTGTIGEYKRKNKLTDKFFNDIMKEIGPGVWDARIHTGNKSKYAIVETCVQSGWKVKQCNLSSDFDWKDLDLNYYIEESEKILIGVD